MSSLKLIPLLMLAVSLFAQTKPGDLPTNTAIAATPAPLTDSKRLELFHLRDSVDPSLAKLRNLPIWPEYQKALDDKAKATDLVTHLETKLKDTPEGKEYIKSANDYAAALQEVVKGVDQSKWGLSRDFIWTPVVAPKPEEPKPAAKDKK